MTAPPPGAGAGRTAGTLAEGLDESKMSPSIQEPRRRDEEGDFHELVMGSCPTCGCTQFHAKDDPAIVWEPGSAWDDACSDRSCSCHSDPVIGARRPG
jgi:hypothetical protein